MTALVPFLLLTVAAGAPAAASAEGEAECERALAAEKFAAAASCYEERARDASLEPVEREAARELAAAARAAKDPPPAPPSEGAVSVSALVESGAPELVVNSAAAGGVAGFLAAGAGLSFIRLNETDSLPWLVGAPAFGLVAGAATAATAAYGLGSTPGDAALISSTMWLGLAEGAALQMIVFDGRTDVGHIPLRFLTPLSVAAGTTALGIGASYLLDVEAGDVGLANSAMLWGPVLTWLTLFTFGADLHVPGEDALAFWLGSGMISAALPWAATLALHPFVDVERPATWLIEAGGLAGATGAFAALVFLSLARLDPRVQLGIMTAGVGAGVAGGTVAAFLLSDVVRALPTVGDFTKVMFSAGPTLLPTAPGSDEPFVPGAVVRVGF